jgi:glutamate synthase domain-containing protein 2/glutamate synthase domain-containing protein 1/glutamate synthase domain-containing protein 3
VIENDDEEPTRQPEAEHSACGVGFVARRDGARDHDTLKDALRALENLEHRGACAADGRSGDGAGVLTDIPYELLGIEPDSVALATIFVTDDPWVYQRAIDVFQVTFEFFGIDVVNLREVPTDPSMLGPQARECMPRILHATLKRPEHCATTASYESLLYRGKQELRRRLKEAGLHRAFFFASLSPDTCVYKALTNAEDLSRFYLDLRDPRFTTRFTLFHRRFSTNTRSTWDKAQPFRVLCHNGEINTIRGNRTWARSREIDLGLPSEELLTRTEISDSGSLNEMVEALTHRSSMRHVEDLLALLMPPAQAESGYYRFWSRALEPWDGPALIAYADGKTVGARLDRNGFRPCRFSETEDCFYLASEAGVFDRADDVVIAKGALGAGSAVRVDLDSGRVYFRDPSDSRENADAQFEPRAEALYPDSVTESVDPEAEWLFGVTIEEIRRVIRPMCEKGKEPIGSMGDTARIAILSDEPRPLFDFLYQHFAQVTNPPLDYLRERLVTDLRTFLGPKPNIFAPKEMLPLEPVFEVDSPVLSLGHMAAMRRLTGSGAEPSRLRSCEIDLVLDSSAGSSGLRQRLEEIGTEALHARDQGFSILILSDRNASAERPPVPSLLGLRSVVRMLNRAGRRLDASLVVDTGDARSVHAISALISFGATAVCPRLALQYAQDAGDENKMVRAFEEGLLKTMSKAGISVVRSYQSSKLHAALGLGPGLIAKYFPGLQSPIGGLELDDIGAAVLKRASEPGLGPRPSTFQLREQSRGENGEKHGMTTARSRLLHSSKKEDLQPVGTQDYESFASAGRADAPLHVRDLIALQPGTPVDVDDVQSVAEIMTTFVSGAMSFGAISPESQRDIILAMREIGGFSNSGEGGENPYYYVDGTTATIKQIASARFGVTAEYLATGKAFEIKVAQGAKPGEGGQLMGVKVDEAIARARHATPGTDLISPPPLHDIYSIEDLSGLIHELREFSPTAPIGVKLVANSNIGTIAVGVAKAGADIIMVSGGDGGTGAAPLSSMKHAGLPWELGLSEVHRALSRHGLRERVQLRVDGGFSTGRDVVVAAALGADGFAFGKLLLVAQGCIMARVCEKNTCPTGIATQAAKYREHYRGNPSVIVALLREIATDARQRMAEVGVRGLSELRGRVDLLGSAPDYAAFCEERHLSLDELLAPVEMTESLPRPQRRLGDLNARVLEESASALGGRAVELDLRIRPIDRAVPARLCYAVARRKHELRMERIAAAAQDGSEKATPTDEELDLAPDTVRLNLTGSAGQGLGVFLTTGITIQLVGEANDSVAKSMSGGRITIRPPDTVSYAPAQNAIIGNCVLYGATGGELFAYGRAGDRFAVRNSGATAVVEGIGMHGCEYMTLGLVLILGEAGANLGAGMTGGMVFVRKDQRHSLNIEYIEPHDLDSEHIQILRRLLKSHYDATKSDVAESFMAESDAGLSATFFVCKPIASPGAASAQSSRGAVGGRLGSGDHPVRYPS